MTLSATSEILASALFFYGLSFLVLGMMNLGRGTKEGASTIFFFMGIIDSIVGYIIMASSFAGAASGTPAINIANSLLVLIFAFTWLSAGIAYLKNQDLVPLGNASIFMAAFMLVFAAFYALNGSWYLFANGISWAWAFSSITLASYEKLSSKVVGWTFIIEAIYTWWIPEAILLLGGQLP